MISLGASAALGLAALVVAKTVLPNQASAKGALMTTASQPAGAPLVVASKALKYGDKLDTSALTVTHVPNDAIPEGAFTTVAQVLMQDHGGAPIVLTPIAAHEPVLPGKLSGPGARPGVAAEVTPGLRAYTIRVNDVSGVGGHALPGDRVDIVLTRDLTPSGAVRHFVSELVLQNVRVLAIDLNADLASDKPATPSTATLEVSAEGSQRLAVASELGKLSLALRRTGEADLAQSLHSPAPTPAAASPVRAPRPARSGGVMIEIVMGARRGGGSAPAMPAPAPAAQPGPAASAHS